MKKIIYLSVVLLLVSACKTSKLPKQKAIEETKTEDFLSFISLKRSDVLEKATKKFGTPTETTKDKNDNYSFITNYYNDANNDRVLSYTYDKKDQTVNHIRLTGDHKANFETTKAALKNWGIKDVKANFLGMHKDDIIKIMGTPDRVNAGNYEFVKDNVSVTFICYEFRENKCSEIYLFWK